MPVFPSTGAPQSLPQVHFESANLLQPAWQPFFSLRWRSAWATICRTGSLERPKIPSPISHNLTHQATQALLRTWELNECETVTKVIADRLADVWFQGLPRALFDPATGKDAARWLLGMLETLDFLTRTQRSYLRHSQYLIPNRARASLRSIHDTLPANDPLHHLRCLAIGLLYRIGAAEPALALHALPPGDRPAYVSAALESLFKALIEDSRPPIALEEVLSSEAWLPGADDDRHQPENSGTVDPNTSIRPSGSQPKSADPLNHPDITSSDSRLQPTASLNTLPQASIPSIFSSYPPSNPSIFSSRPPQINSEVPPLLAASANAGIMHLASLPITGWLRPEPEASTSQDLSGQPKYKVPIWIKSFHSGLHKQEDIPAVKDNAEQTEGDDLYRTQGNSRDSEAGEEMQPEATTFQSAVAESYHKLPSSSLTPVEDSDIPQPQLPVLTDEMVAATKAEYTSAHDKVTSDLDDSESSDDWDPCSLLPSHAIPTLSSDLAMGVVDSDLATASEAPSQAGLDDQVDLPDLSTGIIMPTQPIELAAIAASILQEELPAVGNAEEGSILDPATGKIDLTPETDSSDVSNSSTQKTPVRITSGLLASSAPIEQDEISATDNTEEHVNSAAAALAIQASSETECAVESKSPVKTSASEMSANFSGPSAVMAHAKGDKGSLTEPDPAVGAGLPHQEDLILTANDLPQSNLEMLSFAETPESLSTEPGYESEAAIRRTYRRRTQSEEDLHDPKPRKRQRLHDIEAQCSHSLIVESDRGEPLADSSYGPVVDEQSGRARANSEPRGEASDGEAWTNRSRSPTRYQVLGARQKGSKAGRAPPHQARQQKHSNVQFAPLTRVTRSTTCTSLETSSATEPSLVAPPNQSDLRQLSEPHRIAIEPVQGRKKSARVARLPFAQSARSARPGKSSTTGQVDQLFQHGPSTRLTPRTSTSLACETTGQQQEAPPTLAIQQLGATVRLASEPVTQPDTSVSSRTTRRGRASNLSIREVSDKARPVRVTRRGKAAAHPAGEISEPRSTTQIPSKNQGARSARAAEEAVGEAGVEAEPGISRRRTGRGRAPDVSSTSEAVGMSQEGAPPCPTPGAQALSSVDSLEPSQSMPFSTRTKKNLRSRNTAPIASKTQRHSKAGKKKPQKDDSIEPSRKRSGEDPVKHPPRRSLRRRQ